MLPESVSGRTTFSKSIPAGAPARQGFGAQHNVAAVEFLVVLIAFVGRRKIENIECAGQVFQRIMKIGSRFCIFTYHHVIELARCRKPENG